MMNKNLLQMAKNILRQKKTIRMKNFRRMMGNIRWQDAVDYLHELGWFKLNKYQWASPTMKYLCD